jgi:hypothetical protein
MARPNHHPRLKHAGVSNWAANARLQTSSADGRAPKEVIECKHCGNNDSDMDPKRLPRPSRPTAKLSLSIGGLMFGAGMALVGTCGFGKLGTCRRH